MNTPDSRIHLLQQIPVFAIRELIGAHLADSAFHAALSSRFSIILHRKPRDFQRALQRLNREQLTALVSASPEVTEVEIGEQFEEHRYGVSPSFYIYVFNPSRLNPTALKGFRDCFEEALKEFNARHEEGHPNVRRVALNDLGPLRDRLEVIEATYRFQSRLDYIDEDEKAVSPYETLYGFFWLNTEDGYVILQARQPDVLNAVRDAISSAAGVPLTALVITKRFKNALSFLDVEQMRSVRLHDPLPDSPFFRWISISDDQLYKKDYQTWEDRYPEVRSARYRTVLEDVKETMLTIRCDQGAISLAGAIRASLFRSWCLYTLGEIVKIHNQFAADVKEFVPTLDLTSKAEMMRFSSAQKERILDLIVALLTVKGGGGDGHLPLKVSPLVLAQDLGKLVRVQVPLKCQEPGCDPDEELLVACPNCGNTYFMLQRGADGWELVCHEQRNTCWSGKLPLHFKCANEHPLELDEEMLQDIINILPVQELNTSLATLINNYLKGQSFDLDQESFIVLGSNLWYFPDRGKALARFTIIQNIGTVAKGGTVIGVANRSVEPIGA